MSPNLRTRQSKFERRVRDRGRGRQKEELERVARACYDTTLHERDKKKVIGTRRELIRVSARALSELAASDWK